MGARMSLWLAVSFLAFSDWKKSRLLHLVCLCLPVPIRVTDWWLTDIGRKMRLCMESISSSTWRIWMLQSRTIWLVQLSGDQYRGLESHAHWFWMIFFAIYQWYSLRMSLKLCMAWDCWQKTIFFHVLSFQLAGCIESTRGLSYEKTWQDLPGHARHSAALLLEWQVGGKHLRQSYSQGEEKNEEQHARHVGHQWSWRLANLGMIGMAWW